MFSKPLTARYPYKCPHNEFSQVHAPAYSLEDTWLCRNSVVYDYMKAIPIAVADHTRFGAGDV